MNTIHKLKGVRWRVWVSSMDIWQTYSLLSDTIQYDILFSKYTLGNTMQCTHRKHVVYIYPSTNEHQTTLFQFSWQHSVFLYICLQFLFGTCLTLISINYYDIKSFVNKLVSSITASTRHQQHHQCSIKWSITASAHGTG